MGIDNMKKWIALISVAIAAHYSTFSTADAGTAGDTKAAGQKAVLVTGATRGIGLRITEYLTEKGYFVYAGARKDEDMERLNKMENVQAVRIDVTKPDSIAAAVDTVKTSGRGLYGLVNNAGISVTERMIDISDEDFDAIMQVNVYGPYRVTKAFAPLLIEQKGRVVTIGSKGGLTTVPKWGSYSMSKFAMEAFTDALQMEMKPSGVKVSIVEPGNFSPWGGGDPIKVAKAVENALTSPTPKTRYLVDISQESVDKTMTRSIDRLVQLDKDHEYSIGLDRLVEILQAQYKLQNDQGQPASTPKPQ
jgi:NAD(P)-dependent dehydrogenase (short-subunit alcohol dehydrogenase family)